MDRDKVAATLQNLARTSPNRSKAARLRLVLEDIHTAIEAGVPSREIIAALAENGLVMSPKTFHGTLYRIRKASKRPPMSASARAEHLVQTPQIPRPINEKPGPTHTESAPAPRTKKIEEFMQENPGLTRKQAEELYVDQFQPEVKNPLLARFGVR
jgi:hypothetical protein